MIRPAFIFLLACFAIASDCFAGIPTNFYTIDARVNRQKISVAVTEERLIVYGLVKQRLMMYANSSVQPFDKETTETKWSILGTQIKSKAGFYLAYDPSGNDKKVFLVPKPGEGTEWDVQLKKSSPGDAEHGVIRAASGKLKGWYLDVQVDEPEPTNANDEHVSPRNLILAEKPSSAVEARRIYNHK